MIEIEVNEKLLAEIIQLKCREYDRWTQKVARTGLDSACDIVWILDGLPNELRIQSNLLAAMCIAFHGTQMEGWSLAIDDILALPAKGEMFIEEGRLDAVGDHLGLLNNAFGTSVPESDRDALGILSDFIHDQLASDIWHNYVHELSKRDGGFCPPLFVTSKGTELRARIEKSVESHLPNLMAPFGD